MLSGTSSLPSFLNSIQSCWWDTLPFHAPIPLNYQGQRSLAHMSHLDSLTLPFQQWDTWAMSLWSSLNMRSHQPPRSPVKDNQLAKRRDMEFIAMAARQRRNLQRDQLRSMKCKGCHFRISNACLNIHRKRATGIQYVGVIHCCNILASLQFSLKRLCAWNSLSLSGIKRYKISDLIFQQRLTWLSLYMVSIFNSGFNRGIWTLNTGMSEYFRLKLWLLEIRSDYILVSKKTTRLEHLDF